MCESDKGLCAPKTLSQEINAVVCSVRQDAVGSLIRWFNRARNLEDQLSGTADLAKRMECEALRLQDVNTKLTDENIGLRDKASDLHRKVAELTEALRVSKLENLAAHGAKRDADTAWQREVDSLRAVNPQTEAAAALRQALTDGSWTNNTLLVQHVIAEATRKPTTKPE